VLCRLPYDDRYLNLRLPAISGARIIGDRLPPPLPDPEGAIVHALARPVDSPPLEALVPRSGNISVLISDVTRGGGLRIVLHTVLMNLERAGAGPERVEIMLAMGMHRGHSPEEVTRHLGADVMTRWTVVEHDARDEESLVDLGATPAGTPCFFSSRVVSSALVVCLGTLSFHYFAGFGGGRKLILPGVAAERTIVANHRLSLRTDPGGGLAEGCAPGNLDGNPVHEDMLAGAGLLAMPVFAVNTIHDAAGALIFVNGGDLAGSHRLACDRFAGLFTVPIDRAYRTVIVSAGGYPKDINLLQSHKAIRHASYALEAGGTMLAVAACREGIGSISYGEAFSDGREAVPAKVRRRYTLNAQTAVSTYQLTGCYDIHLASMLPEGEAARFGFTPFRAERAADLLTGTRPGDILIIRNGSLFLPRLSR